MTELPHREQTDESLRLEREIADQALADEQAAIDEVADAVIARARARADAVLAAARERADRGTAGAPPSPVLFKRERALEDRLLQEERANADEVLRDERIGQAVQVSTQREETDNDLSFERVVSDDVQATLDGLLDVLSHDVRPRLNAMVGLASAIESGVSRDNDQVRVSARHLQRSGAAANRLLQDLVDVVSLDVGTFSMTREVTDPSAVVTEAVEAFQVQAAARGIALAVETAPGAGLASFDSARILEVLTHLLSKAIKRTPAQGSVRVRVEGNGNRIHFAVSDTGGGVAAGDLKKMFDRFDPSKAHQARGAGLRLYVCQCIIREHGGDLWAEDNAGTGVTFCFNLPSSAA